MESHLMPLGTSKAIVVVFLYILCSVSNYVTQGVAPTYFDKNCFNVGNYTQNSTYQKNLHDILSKLTAQSSVTTFYNLTTGEGLDKVYALYFCRGDILVPDCHTCIQDAAVMVIQECNDAVKEAIIWYEECTLHFANRSIFSSEEELPRGYYGSTNNVSMSTDLFEQILSSTMDDLTKEAAYNNNAHGFVTGEANLTADQKLYCLVQCAPDILGSPCERCLDTVIRDRPTLCGVGRVWTMIYLPSCQLRYDLAPFYVNRGLSTQFQPGQHQILASSSAGKYKFFKMLAIVVSLALAVVSLLLCGISFFLYREKVEQRQKGLAPYLRTFTYGELAKITDNFKNDNLIGQGGFGYVYKGVLPSDNRAVAIKRLRQGSVQGEHEFLTEIEFISRIHHRNLVTLVGYCISGSHKLLVYEYVPNNSLYTLLHGSDPPLEWATRMKIAVGSAKGLEYLHEDCEPRIIHRDIKSTNILLGSEFEAKVADFGLAKFYTDSKTHITTDVKGTPGYLAPEYNSSGQLTEKSDVFSFGVVLLELITGRKPTCLIDWAAPLIYQAVQYFDLDALVDPSLEMSYNHNEMVRMIVCATMCVHRLPERRIKMSQVVRLLEGNMSMDDIEQHPWMSASVSSFSSNNSYRAYAEDLERWAFEMRA